MAGSPEEMIEFYGYSPGPIRVELGVSVRGVGSEAGRVFMYKRMPGLYLDDLGGPVSDEQAQKAGFDVDKDRLEANRLRSIQEQTARINETYDKGGNPFVGSAVEVEVKKVEGGDPLGNMADIEKVEITERSSEGKRPRGTRDFYIEHTGGGKFALKRKANQEVVEAGLVTGTAELQMLQAQADLDRVRETMGGDASLTG